MIAYVSDTTFNYFSFNEDILDVFQETKAKEIHDKTIVSTAKLLRAKAVITKDGELHELGEVETLW